MASLETYHLREACDSPGQLDILLLLHVSQQVRGDGVEVKLTSLRMLELLLDERVAQRGRLFHHADVLVLALCVKIYGNLWPSNLYHKRNTS